MPRVVHLCAAIFWVVMIVPTITLWKQSILLILMMSLYANIESSMAAYNAGKRKPKIKYRKWSSSGLTHIVRHSNRRN